MQENNHNTSQGKTTINPGLSLSFLLHTNPLYLFYTVYIIVFFVGAAHPALLQRQCECVCAGGGAVGAPR